VGATRAVLLRPGAISRGEMEAALGTLPGTMPGTRLGCIANAGDPETGSHPAPGMHPRHYSPRTTLYLTTDGKLPDLGAGIFLQHEHPPNRSGVTIRQMPRSAADYAAALYGTLHCADEENYDWIAVDTPPSTPEWEAVHDRLRRAATEERT